MKFKSFLVIAGFLTCIVHSYGNGLEISNVTPNEDYTQISFDISWENSWRQTERFHDAVWVFIKYRPDNGIRWEHASLTDGIASGNLEVISQPDSVGIFLRNDADFVGNVPVTNVTVDVSLDPTITIHPDFKVFGIEMVYVPEEGFYYSDNRMISRKFIDINDVRCSSWRDSLKISQFIDEENITLNYYDRDNEFAELIMLNDQVMSSGYSDFYCMKYPITQGQFVDFLNCLTEEEQEEALSIDIFNPNNQNQFLHDLPSYRQGIYIATEDTTEYNSILFVNDLNRNGIFNEPDDGKDIVLSFNFAPPVYDSAFIYPMLSFLFWSGLSPMNEMQYEKACRGPMKPMKSEYAWGHSVSVQPPSLIDEGTSNERFSVNTELPPRSWHNIGETHPLFYRAGISSDAGDDRISAGKSFWGISDLSGNGSELVLGLEAIYYLESGNNLLLGKGDPEIPVELTDMEVRHWDRGASRRRISLTFHHVWLSKRAVSGINELLFFRNPNSANLGKATNTFSFEDISGRGIR